MFKIIEVDVDIGLKDKDYEKASVVVLYHLDIAECKLPDDIAANFTYADYLEGLYGVEARNGLTVVEPTFTEEQLHHILELVNKTYVPESHHEVRICWLFVDCCRQCNAMQQQKVVTSRRWLQATPHNIVQYCARIAVVCKICIQKCNSEFFVFLFLYI